MPLRVLCCASSAVGGAHPDREWYCRPGDVYGVVLGVESSLFVIRGQWYVKMLGLEHSSNSELGPEAYLVT